MNINNISEELKKSFDEYSIENIKENIEELRFSNNSMDIYNIWDYNDINIFVSKNKKIASMNVKDNDYLKKLNEIIKYVPDNNSYYGMNPDIKEYKDNIHEIDNNDIYDLFNQLIDSAIKNNGNKNSGLIYKISTETTIKTKYGEKTFHNNGIEIVIRSFNNNFSGQEGLHFGYNAIKKIDPYKIGEEAAITSNITGKTLNIPEGKYDVLLSPEFSGSIITANIDSLSYYNIDSGLSPFIDKINTKVGSNKLSIYDDPLNNNGIGFRPFDDENTNTNKVNLISNGVLKSYMHSYSTASESGYKTTGNAGIIYPHPWQIHVKSGNKHISDLINDIDNGFYIKNSWYTRFQDEKSGTFSTVPRDGVFYIKNGKIVGTVSGIRISDSILNILNNIDDISDEEKYVKWWNEINSSIMPSMIARNINITKGF